MANGAYDHLKLGHEVLFAFEEAIGYMCGCTVLDKDGISAAAVMAEFAGWLEAQGKTFRQQLEELYVRYIVNHSLSLCCRRFLYVCAYWFYRYGRFESEVSYFICHSKETITMLFDSLRSREGGKVRK